MAISMPLNPHVPTTVHSDPTTKPKRRHSRITASPSFPTILKSIIKLPIDGATPAVPANPLRVALDSNDQRAASEGTFPRTDVSKDTGNMHGNTGSIAQSAMYRAEKGMEGVA